MRVTIVARTLFGATKGGGERYVSEAGKSLARLGIKTTMLSITRCDRYFTADAEGPLRPIRFEEANRVVQTADVVHVHQLNSPGFDYAALACRYYNKPLVLTDHGGGWLNAGRIFGRHRLRFVDGGAFVSEWSAQDIDPKHQIKHRRVVLGGGDHLPLVGSWEERYDFGFVGRILPHKGLHIIVEALPKDARLVIAGQVRDPVYMAEIQALAAGKNVTILPDADDRAVAALYRSVRHLLVPSVWRYRNKHFTRPELMGFVALEALSAGTPVIGSDIAGLGEILRVAGQRTLPPGDVKAWHDGLTKAMEGNPRKVEPGAFTWDAVGRRCIGLYESLLPGSQKRK